MISDKMAERISHDWITAWNGCNMDALLSHYSDDIELTSPMVVRDMRKPIGSIKGKDNVRNFYAKGFELYPDLQYSLTKVFAGVDSILFCYTGIHGRPTAAYMALDYDGLAKKVVMHYGTS